MASNPPRSPRAPETCPVCGEEDVPRRALACPQCGADHRSGWREDAAVDAGTGLPDEDGFDYDGFVQREFGGSSARPPGIKPVWWITALLMLAVFGWISLRGVWWL